MMGKDLGKQAAKPSRHGGDVYRNQNVELDFSVNLNPLGMPVFVREAAEKSITFCERYPDSECGRLKELAAKAYAMPKKRILFGNGAADLIFRIVRAKRPKRAVLLAPSFLEYEAALKSEGASVDFFYLKEEAGFQLPVGEYLDFLSRVKPELVFLCNPSNPVGNVIGREGLEQILSFCGSVGIFCVVDECFLEFLENGEELSCAADVRAGNRMVFVLQAATKTFAMAGLRLGYGFLADEPLKRSMEAGCQPWNLSVPAQEAGCAAFGPERAGFLRETRQVVRRERGRLADALGRAGFHVYPSSANFLLFRDTAGNPDGALYEYCLRQGILIRPCGNYEGLDGSYYRVCVGNPEANQKLIEVLERYL